MFPTLAHQIQRIYRQDVGQRLEVSGLVLILLTLPRGQVRHSYGSWNRFIV
jgi:hypothetical protein